MPLLAEKSLELRRKDIQATRFGKDCHSVGWLVGGYCWARFVEW